MDGGKTFRHGFHDIQGFILSHLWVPLWRACYILEFPFFYIATFFQALYFAFFIKSEHWVLCAMERKRTPQCHLKLVHIEWHMHWKLKHTKMHSPIKEDIIYLFFQLKVLYSFIEVFRGSKNFREIIYLWNELQHLWAFNPFFPWKKVQALLRVNEPKNPKDEETKGNKCGKW